MEVHEELPSMAGPSVKHVGPPHPEWKPGDRQPPPFKSAERVVLDPDKEEAKALYPFIISSIVPRPIGFISTVSKEGVGNLSPYSYFNVLSHDPPHVCIGAASTGSQPNRMKDSQTNIIETKEFTLNMVSEWFLEAMNHTCGEYDREVDEIKLAGLTTQPSTKARRLGPVAKEAFKVKPPRIAEASVQLECRLRSTYDVWNKHGAVTGTILIAEVLLIHVLKDVTTETPHSKTMIVDFDKYQPVSRLGGNSYARVTEVYDLPRPPKEAQYRLYPETKPAQ